MGAVGLLFFEFHRFGHDFSRHLTGLSLVLAGFSAQGIETAPAVFLEFAFEGGKRWRCHPAIGKHHLRLSRLLKKLMDAFLLDFLKNDRP